MPAEGRTALRIGLRLGLLLVLLVPSVMLAGRIPAAPNSYFAAVVDKHQRLASLPSPKLAMIGGSGVALSVDSQAIQTAMGMPVVNMGLHAGLGLAFMLDEVDGHLTAGDVALVSPEYALLAGDADNTLTKAAVLTYLPDPWHYLTSPFDAIRYFVQRAQLGRKAFPRWLLGKPAPDLAVYAGTRFNTFGDMVGHLSQTGVFDVTHWDPTPLPAQRLNGAALSRLERFAARAREAGATVAFVHPALLDMAYERDRATIGAVDTAVRAIAARTGMLVISNVQESLFSLGDIFDTPYHLNAAGRQKRTQRLIRGLQDAGVGQGTTPRD